ncbi:Batten's disease protein Cln3 [Xylariaceae sp. FL0594]|nr:Batten's disease protein Cln3 [Xylariaceae sp. FL0594]
MPLISRSPSSSGLLPMPGSPSASWSVYKARLTTVWRNWDMSVLAAFWLFGLINNVLYVIILSAAQDLVGSNAPKGLVLLADVLPSFFTKLIAPYFIHKVPYSIRIIFFAVISSAGMFLIALTPPDKSVGVKMLGVVLASLASGGGELSFLGLTHYYGHMSLAAWGSGTGAAGLVGAGLYVLLTDWLGFRVKNSLLASAYLPVIMVFSFFLVLPKRPLLDASKAARDYEPLPDSDDTVSREVGIISATNAASVVLSSRNEDPWGRVLSNLRRTKSLFFPYMLPLLLVYVAEYTINQGVSPTCKSQPRSTHASATRYITGKNTSPVTTFWASRVTESSVLSLFEKQVSLYLIVSKLLTIPPKVLFPLDSSPFTEYRDFYPMYGFLYQLGVFISRSSIAFIRIRHLYLPSLLQVGNLVLLTLHSLLNFIPSVYIVFLIVFWEGLLGGGVYVNTFAGIMETVPLSEREFSLGATSVSDSAGICIAGFAGMAMEVWLCNYQVAHGRDWCKKIQPS